MRRAAAACCMVTGHFGNWELHAIVHGCAFGPIGVVARPLDNPALDARLCGAAHVGGNTRDLQAARAAGRAGAAARRPRVAILIDQNVQAATASSWTSSAARPRPRPWPRRCAVKTGCALVAGLRRAAAPDGRYRLIYEPAARVDARAATARADIARLTQELTGVIERWVREQPEQWLWLHRRWKTQPPAGSGARGVSVRADRRARAELDRRRRAVAAGRCATCGATSRRRASRSWRGRGWPSSTAPCPRWTACCASRGLRADAASAARRASTRPCCCRTRSRSALPPFAGAHPRALGLRDRRPRPAAHARGAACRRRSGAAARCTTIARCSRASASRSRPTRRVARAVRRAWRGARRASCWATTGRWIGLNPGAFYGTRQALAARALRRGGRALARRTGARVAILGRRRRAAAGRGDRRAACARRRASCAARRSLRSWWACSSRLRLLVTNDSGPMHLAAALGTPLVAIFGPTDWRETAPVGARTALVRERRPLRALHAARVPDRPSLHDAHRRRARGRARPGAARREAPRSEPAPAIFMDRDGTLSHEVGYVNHLSRFRLFPFAVDAVRLINRSGFLAVVVTNQAGVARGYFPESLIHEVHAAVRAAHGGRAARASTASTSACTTPAWASRPTARTATAASRSRACCAARRRGARRRPRALVGDRRPARRPASWPGTWARAARW